MKENAKALFDLIALKNPIHAKYLKKIEFNNNDILEFDRLVSYYLQSGLSLEKLSECYLLILNDTLEETKYFIENGTYRYSSFDEVKDKVYFNKSYMKAYMIGLALSSYIWIAHIKVRKYFENFLLHTKDKNLYLEIGPGHGEFFAKAIKSEKFNSYVGIDISPTSCELTKEMVSYKIGNLSKNYEFLCKDFFTYNFEKKADLIVMGEILEHVEKPLIFLKRAYELLDKEGEVFATIPINAPAIDHIYLFKDPKEVEDLIQKAGFYIKEKEFFMANNYSLEKALKFKNAITMVVVLGKKC
ncbi:class I SAM-dependent methyltransferase [Campylobacter novaezeelandiae]|uniref:class I SAM-dependent methyltransferase n=1 Tax=Campylobacter novaezeelandiae TaxID=2267891 RepID=UPI0019068DC2|nr:class I SAM-dependent methyltransferase [Campylobacter novaezeelandiae]MBK1964670.1 class I SAM-dependent methyltransferase [Campylobacter novaezeelandiae]MBK1993970.1 class I SAM-dependent methyltransferase [Campylobacter novaezeelandiae]